MHEAGNLYGIIDCARDPRLYGLVTRCREHACLFAGSLDPILERVAPHLVRLDPVETLAAEWNAAGPESHWGIRCRSTLGLAGLRRHLRFFLQATLPDGTTALFRFYDPRVWRVYWPALAEDERQAWLSGMQPLE